MKRHKSSEVSQSLPRERAFHLSCGLRVLVQHRSDEWREKDGRNTREADPRGEENAAAGERSDGRLQPNEGDVQASEKL